MANKPFGPLGAGCRKHATIALLLARLMSPTVWAGSVAYSYDALGRVIRVQYSSGVVLVYAYDAAGNRTSYIVSGAPK